MQPFETISALLFMWLMPVLMWFVVPAWLTLQIATLVRLRGVAQALCVVPIPYMAWVALITHESYRANSNLSWLVLTFSAPAALLWVTACRWLSSADAALKLRLTKLAGFVVAGITLLSVPVGLFAGVQGAKERERQSREADAIIAAIGARVLIGTVHGDGVARAWLASVEARIKAENYIYQSCYEHGVRVDPGTSGSAFIALAIQPDGVVSSAAVTRSSGADSAERCIVRTLRGLRFDGRADAGETVVTIPMLLEQT